MNEKLDLVKEKLTELENEETPQEISLEGNEEVDLAEEFANRLRKIDSVQDFFNELLTTDEEGENEENEAEDEEAIAKVNNVLRDKIESFMENTNSAWPDFLPSPETHDNKTLLISNAAQVRQLLDAIAQKKSEVVQAEELRVKLQAFPSKDDFEQSEYENYLTMGEPPDNLVNLALDNGTNNGLKVEEMLKEMRAQITEDAHFDMFSKNCSTTASSILAAGAQGAYLKAQFQNRALGAIANPQMVLNNVLAYEQALRKPKDNILKKIARFSPLNVLYGKVLDAALSPHVHGIAKWGARVALIPFSIIKGVVESIEAIADPLKTVKNLANFINYAYTKPSIGLRIAATIIAVPPLVILAVPAEIQAIGSQIVKRIKSFFKAPIKKVDLAVQSGLSESELQAHAELDRKLMESVNKDIEEISQNNPQQALQEFGVKLHDPHKIVILSNATKRKVEAYIAKIQNVDEKQQLQRQYQLFTNETLSRIQAKQKSPLAESDPKKRSLPKPPK